MVPVYKIIQHHVAVDSSHNFIGVMMMMMMMKMMMSHNSAFIKEFVNFMVRQV
jgi:hypothetical protein